MALEYDLGGHPYRELAQEPPAQPGLERRRHRPQPQLRLRLVARRRPAPRPSTTAAAPRSRRPRPRPSATSCSAVVSMASSASGPISRSTRQASSCSGHTATRRTPMPPDMTRLDALGVPQHGPAYGRHQRLPAGAIERPVPDYGDEIDWLYGTQRIFSYTFEMYPTTADTSPSRHYPPDEVIGRETRRNREAVLYLMEQADCPYRATRPCRVLLWAAATTTSRSPGLDDRPRRHRHGDGRRLATGRSRRRWTATRLGDLGPCRPRHRAQQAGVDVDGGRTTIGRGHHLPSNKAATLQLRYWVGMSAPQTLTTRSGSQVVRPGDGHVLTTALTVTGDRRRARAGAGRPGRFASRRTLRGTDVAVSCGRRGRARGDGRGRASTTCASRCASR